MCQPACAGEEGVSSSSLEDEKHTGGGGSETCASLSELKNLHFKDRCNSQGQLNSDREAEEWPKEELASA